MEPSSDIRDTFFQECEDLLGEMEAGLLDIENGEADEETVNAVFRAVHSIKGGAGAFGLEQLVRFAHSFETVLDGVRSNQIPQSADTVSLLLRAADALADLVACARDGADADDATAKALIEELSRLVAPAGDGDGADDEELEDIDFEPVAVDFDLGAIDDMDAEDADSVFIVTFKPKQSLYACANDALLILRNLSALGEATVECDVCELPTLDDIDPEEAYLTWRVRLKTSETIADVEEVFAFVEDDCMLEIGEAEGSGADFDDAEPDNACDPDDPENSCDPDEADKSGETVEDEAPPEVQEAAATAGDEQPAAAPASQPQPAAGSGKASPQKAAQDTTIRVSLNRVDRLVNLVGELVINQAMLAQGVIEAGLARGSSVETGLEELKQLTREIQEGVMSIRAQPVKTLFQRMSRIVREAGHATQKKVRLVMEGEATEVDKTVVERLADPLTHMIRNAVDHGLESPEDRAARGKPEEGIVRLSASHRSGRVVIEVADDGAGIDRERVKSIAISKGLIPEDAALADAEIDNLLFMPGFSTASEVSDLSGRGVGMDVVKRAIQAVGGKVSITSQPNVGSTFTISLPLTLAVLDGMIVSVAGQTLVVPLTAITETLKPQRADIHPLGRDSHVVSIRGEFIPIIDIGVDMGYRSEPVDPAKAVMLSVETDNGERAAIALDGIQDQRQVVIKSLEENYQNVPGVSAATILGDGRIALILDVESIIARSTRHAPAQELQLAAVG